MRLHMTNLSGALLVILAVFTNSCSGPAGFDNSPAPAPMMMPSAETGSSRAYSPPKPDRPGLATGWGDQKDSAVSYRNFARASSRPAATDVIFYNDPAGLEAMAGSKKRVSGSETVGGLVEWGIKGRFGFLPTYQESGFGRRLVAGSKGTEYSIWIKNRSRSTLEVVASVDGLDVQDGKTASFSKRGYVIAPGKTLEIEGFRSGCNTVAAFEFSGVGNSYANLKHGDTRNVGVIGLAVFTQKGYSPWTGGWNGDTWNRNSASPFAEAP